MLLQNSLKHTLRGYIKLQVEIKSTIVEQNLRSSQIGHMNHQEIVFTISDTGSGINLADQKDLFTLFSNPKAGHTSTSVGLGLSYCKAVIDKMDGQISFKSDGEGTTITFSVVIGHDDRDTGLTNMEQT